MRVIAADDARVCFHRKVLHATTIKDAFVGVIHFFVARHRTFVRGVERIGVFHDEFFRAHQTEARADFIAELAAHLIKILRQLAIRIDLTCCQRRDDLLGSRTEKPLATRAVLDLEQNIAGSFGTTTLLPNVGRLQSRHEDFNRIRTIHFLADDLFNLAQSAESKRQKGINATRKLTDESRTQQQFVRNDLRIRRSFAEGRNQSFSPAHDVFIGKISLLAFQAKQSRVLANPVHATTTRVFLDPPRASANRD